MPQDPFPLPPGDAGEPDGSALPAADGTGAGDIGEGLEQGLYVTLPAGQLTLAGFGQGGASDTMAPGALLAAVAEAVAGEDGAGCVFRRIRSLSPGFSDAAGRRPRGGRRWGVTPAWSPPSGHLVRSVPIGTRVQCCCAASSS